MCKKYFIKIFRPNKNHKKQIDKGNNDIGCKTEAQWPNKAINQYKYHFLFIKF